MQLLLLRTPRLQIGTAQHALPPHLPSWLLAYLALRGERVLREHVYTVFWPERGEAEAQQNLRVNLYRLRDWLRACDAEPILHVKRQLLGVEVDSDVARFRAALRQGDTAAALAAYTGPLLGDWSPRGLPALGDWLQLERDALQRQCRALVLATLGEPQRAGAGAARHADADVALSAAARLAQGDALDEELHVAWYAALLARGRTQEAADGCRALADRVRRELQVDPGLALVALAERADAALRAAARSRGDDAHAHLVLDDAEAALTRGDHAAADTAVTALLPTLAYSGLRRHALVLLGRARASAGRIDEAAALATEARALDSAAPPRNRAADPVDVQLGLLEHLVLIRQGRTTQAFEMLRRHLDSAAYEPGRDDTPDLAGAWLSLSTWHIDADRDAEGAAAARRAIDIARRCNDTSTFVYAASNLLAAQQRLGAPEEALPLAEAALALPRVDGSDLLRANLARCHLMRGEPWRALPHAQRLVTEAAGSFVEPLAHAALGDALIGVGRVAEGRAALRRALRALDASAVASVRARVLLSVMNGGERALLPQVRALLPALTGAQLQAATLRQLRAAAAQAGLDVTI